MNTKRTGIRSSAIGLMVILILIGFLLVVPVSADAGEVVAWGQNNYGQVAAQITAQPGSDSTPVSAGHIQNQALNGVPPMEPTVAPEFPTIAAPLMLIVGFAGAVIFTRWGH